MKGVPLRRVAHLVNGGTPTGDIENWNGDVPWATPVDLAGVDGSVLDGTQRLLTRHGLRSGSASVPPGSILLSTRAPIGYVTRTRVETAFNQGCRGIVPRSAVEVRYLQYTLVANRASLISAGTGSTFQELSTEALANSAVPLHSLPQQRRIADFLDDQVARLDQTAREAALLAELAQAREQAVASELVGFLFASCPTAPLRRFVIGIEQGSSPLAAERPAGVGESGVLKTSAIAAGVFRPDQNKALLDSAQLERRFLLFEGDLLVVRGSGSTNLVGDVAVVDALGDAKLMLSDLTYRLRAPRVPAQFLAAVLLSPPVRGAARLAVRQGSGPAKLRGQDILDLPVPVAERQQQVDLLTRIASERAFTRELHTAAGAARALVEERKRALVTACVTGEFDLSAASDRAGDAALAHVPRAPGALPP
jgi:type I restriction enzyme S subunit